MPGVDVSLISSNWRILQARLKAGQDAEKSLKRKRVEKDKDSTANITKRPRSEQAAGPRQATRSTARKMGSVVSSEPQGSAAAPAVLKDLHERHDISRTDIGAAYGEGFVELGSKDVVNEGRSRRHKAGRYLALDCEMVGTGPPPYRDDVLARVSIVNFHGEQVYDSYVQAPAGIEVLDYRTHVSGIEEQHMSKGVARPFAEVQKEVAQLTEGNILVGHAVQNDLQCLQLNHPRPLIRDTSRHKAYRIETRGKPPALRNLAKQYLGVTIQESAHSSLEDARATMMLYKRDKTAFEDFSRKTYGAPRLGRRQPASVEQAELSDDDLDNEDELPDDEDEDEAEDSTQVSSPKAKKKHKKKKKRTKR